MTKFLVFNGKIYKGVFTTTILRNGEVALIDELDAGSIFSGCNKKDLFNTEDEASAFLAKEMKRAKKETLNSILTTKRILTVGTPDVVKFKKDFLDFCNSKGKVYNMCETKEPNYSFFFEAYFGDEDFDCEYGRYFCNVPHTFKAKNKKSFELLVDFLENFTYEDMYSQSYCELLTFDKELICHLNDRDMDY